MVRTDESMVVLPTTGGVARDIHQFCVHAVAPKNELAVDDEGYAARQKIVDQCIEMLPKIMEAGQHREGMHNSRHALVARSLRWKAACC